MAVWENSVHCAISNSILIKLSRRFATTLTEERAFRPSQMRPVWRVPHCEQLAIMAYYEAELDCAGV